MLYTDDTSGNKSKKWHLFNSWSIVLAGLPHSHNSQLGNIHFICCSDRVSVLDMAEPIVEQLLDLERDGTVLYHAHLDCQVLVVAPVLCILADKPEVVNHLQGSPVKFCRMCMVMLSVKVCMINTCIALTRKATPPAIGPTRSSMSSLRQILQIRGESAKIQRRKMYGLTEVHNPLLSLPLNLYQ